MVQKDIEGRMKQPTLSTPKESEENQPQVDSYQKRLQIMQKHRDIL